MTNNTGPMRPNKIRTLLMLCFASWLVSVVTLAIVMAVLP